MRRMREQIETELLATAEELIEELLDWERQAGRPDLTAMVDKVLALRQRLGPRLLAVVIEDQGARQPAVARTCAQCGAVMRYKGQKGTHIESRLVGLRRLHLTGGQAPCYDPSVIMWVIGALPRRCHVGAEGLFLRRQEAGARHAHRH